MLLDIHSPLLDQTTAVYLFIELLKSMVKTSMHPLIYLQDNTNIKAVSHCGTLSAGVRRVQGLSARRS